jgi:hypothetical protein
MSKSMDEISGLEAILLERETRESWGPSGRPEKPLTTVWNGIYDLAGYGPCGMYGLGPADVTKVADISARMFLAALDAMAPKEARKVAAKLQKKLAEKI